MWFPVQCRATLPTVSSRSKFQHRQARGHLARVLSTSEGNPRGKIKPDSADTLSGDTQGHISSTAESNNATDVQSSNSTDPTAASASSPPATQPSSVEELVRKFKLKPSAEVGIRVRLREKQRKQEEDEATKRANEEESRSGAEKIQRLFEKLQLGANAPSVTGAGPGAGKTLPDNVSGPWKFLFDEDDLTEGESNDKTPKNESKEMLDTIPGASDLFPTLSEYRVPTSSSPSSTPPSTLDTTAPLAPLTSSASPKMDRWKDPKMKTAEKDAFKALFSSLFEHKPSKEETAPGGKVQSLFSNFNRSGLERPTDGLSSTPYGINATESASQPYSPWSQTPSDYPVAMDEDPMQVLRRQLENLSKRVDPIYLDKKPKTLSFQAMEDTAGRQDWMNQDPTMPQGSSLFAVIQSENKVAIRMRKDLEEKSEDIIKVKEFVDGLIAPFVEPSVNADTERPSTVSLDGLLAQAIMVSSSTQLSTNVTQNLSTKSKRALHPFMGHAFVEHTRRQGLPVFIRTVRTESYKALLKVRWERWRDSFGCLEILKEMRGSGALVDAETKSFVQTMLSELKSADSQSGWEGNDEMDSIKEMVCIIKSAQDEQVQDFNTDHRKRKDEKPKSNQSPKPRLSNRSPKFQHKRPNRVADH
ncbi:hypothetical protein BG011_005102 [Mortierella polycephala]|uniref:Mtf2-like C-terminal domain-containing protein n=1 Tax=Mortierella polycephala TaxID=41804 RepID=A0A9P6U1S6_9FUNG|nr:hypothetical protein BG011_005102 [Mortierella polycephala]